MNIQTRGTPATADACPSLADDLLHGAEAIAIFGFGNVSHRRKVYYYASDAKVSMPVFRIDNVICDHKSKLIEWIAAQERDL